MSFFESPTTIKRYIDPVEYDDSGLPIPSAEIIITIYADVQPITGKELDTMQIGSRQIGMIKMTTSEELNVSDEITQLRGDRVLFDGDEYELVERQDWNKLLPHYKYIGELRKNDD